MSEWDKLVLEMGKVLRLEKLCEWLVRKIKGCTRWLEKSVGYDSLAWVCEQCDFTTQFDSDEPKEHGYNFCPRCGCRITEYIKYVDPLDEWVEGE